MIVWFILECVIPSSTPKNADVIVLWDGNQFKLNYSCHAGHSLINGSLTRTCNNSNWTGSIPNCLPGKYIHHVLGPVMFSF
jgi:hypothetical protein